MILLAFDTCLDKTYITLSDNEKIIRSEVILSDGENYHSAYLISTIVKVLKEAGMKPSDIDMISTDTGPGSFTGIRACVTVARVLSQQLNIKAVGVSSLEILSHILGDDDLVVLDARKNKAYLYDKKLYGAVELEEVDKIVSGRKVITDNRLLSRFINTTKEVLSYQQANFELGEILSELVVEKMDLSDWYWSKLLPLYIQPPPVTVK